MVAYGIAYFHMQMQQLSVLGHVYAAPNLVHAVVAQVAQQVLLTSVKFLTSTFSVQIVAL
jgi:hypothetical protein